MILPSLHCPSRCYLLVTEDVARYRSSSLLPFHHGGICSSVITSHSTTTAEPSYLTHRGCFQCSTFIGQQPTLYPTDDSRIAFVCSLFTRRALEWATAVWDDDHAAFPYFISFIQSFKEVFEHPAGGKEVGEQLLSLLQRGGSVADYALSFRTLAAQTGWRDADPLKLVFCRGLSPNYNLN